MTAIDPVSLEIIRNAFVAAAEEMSVTIWRTSRSTIVRDVLDYSTCVFDADGESVAQAARIPVHLNSMASCLSDILEGPIPLEHWHEGDLVITNDPYAGGQHLPDVLTFKPVFLDGRRIAIAGVLVHHLDVGGGAPGSYDPRATEIYQEGFRIPPLKLDKAGVRNREVIALFLRNSREPEIVGGDFNSQLAALEIGVQSLQAIGARYGADRLARACKQIQAQSEAAMRAAIAAIPDGDYAFEDFVDDDGIELDAPLRISVELKIEGDRAVVDLSRSSPQAKGPVNCTDNMTASAVVCALLMSVGADVPANAGCTRPISVLAPPGLCVSALAPAPVANRMCIGHRVVNAVMGAFAEARPGCVPAAYYGVSYAYAFAAHNADGSRQVYFDIEVGGWGGHPEADGANAFSCGFHNLANTPIEMIENVYPLTFLRYGLAPDTGGAGRHRGGLGLVRAFRIDCPAGTFTANLDRFKIPPYGLDGGRAGAPGRLAYRPAPDGAERALPSKLAGLALRQGDVLSLTTSGGGGWGDPAGRTEAALAADLDEGYVSAEAAARDYRRAPG